jgi:3-phosphoshikimate 1-carboxyvinyltransferase
MPSNSITLPGSKSISIRALVLAAMAKGTTRLSGILLSQDTEVLIQALIELGIEIDLDKLSLTCVINGCNGQFPKQSAKIWCAASGLTARFLIAMLSTQGGVYTFDGDASLRARPLGGLLKMLEQQGVIITPPDATTLPLTLDARSVLNEASEDKAMHVSGEVSSQFLSAQLLSAPLTRSRCVIDSKALVSQPYVAMTCHMMKCFGVEVDQNVSHQYVVPKSGGYTACPHYLIEPDASSASYFFAVAAVLGKKICLENVDCKNSLQGDIRFLDVLVMMGCVVKQIGDDLVIHGAEKLSGVEVDMGDISDTMMTLAAVAPFADSPTVIKNIAHARLKESDRIAAMEDNLTQMGVRVESGKDWLKIYPGKPKAITVRCYDDHRIAMSCAVIGLKVPGMEFDTPECVSKTFPDFFELFLQALPKAQ